MPLQREASAYQELLAQDTFAIQREYFMEFLEDLDAQFDDKSIGAPVLTQLDERWATVRQTDSVSVPDQPHASLALRQIKYSDENVFKGLDQRVDLIAIYPYVDSEPETIAKPLGGLLNVHPERRLWTPRGEVRDTESFRSLIVLTNFVLKKTGLETYQNRH